MMMRRMSTTARLWFAKTLISCIHWGLLDATIQQQSSKMRENMKGMRAKRDDSVSQDTN